MGTKKSGDKPGDIIFDKQSGIAIHKDQLVKMFEAGEFVLKEDLEIQKKEQRRKIPKTLVNQTLIYFLDSFFQMEEGTINGAITDMLKRKNGHYKFKVISEQIKTITHKKDAEREVQERKFIADQVSRRYKNLEGVKLQIKLMTQELKHDDPDFYLQHSRSSEDKEKYPEIDEWFYY